MCAAESQRDQVIFITLTMHLASTPPSLAHLNRRARPRLKNVSQQVQANPDDPFMYGAKVRATAVIPIARTSCTKAQTGPAAGRSRSEHPPCLYDHIMAPPAALCKSHIPSGLLSSISMQNHSCCCAGTGRLCSRREVSSSFLSSSIPTRSQPLRCTNRRPSCATCTATTAAAATPQRQTSVWKLVYYQTKDTSQSRRGMLRDPLLALKGAHQGVCITDMLVTNLSPQGLGCSVWLTS